MSLHFSPHRDGSHCSTNFVCSELAEHLALIGFQKRQRLSEVVQDMERQGPGNGPWKYKLCQAYDNPEVKAATKSAGNRFLMVSKRQLTALRGVATLVPIRHGTRARGYTAGGS
jgi:hypothetical protein